MNSPPLRALIRLFSSHSARADRVLSITIATLLAILSVLMVVLGPAPMKAPWDVFILLDGGWRITNGQVPHVDYHNPIGPLTYLAVAFGMKIAKPSLSSVVYGNLLVLVVLTPWAWWTARNRLSSVNAALFVIWVAFLVLTPRPLGYGVTTTTYAMLYNRYGYAILSILFIGLFVQPRISSRAAHILDGLSWGTLVGLLLYCKITYFVAGVALAGLRFALRRDSRRSIPAAALGLVVVVVAVQMVLHIPLFDYLRDVGLSGRAQSLDMRLSNLRASVGWNWLAISLTIALLLVSRLCRTGPMGGARERDDGPWVVVGVALVAQFFITTGNAAEIKDLPVFFLSGLLLLESLLGRTQMAEKREEFGKREAACLLAILIVYPVFYARVVLKDVISTAYYLVWNGTRRAMVGPSQRFESDALREFVIPESSDWQTAYWRARDVPQRLNEGFALLRRHASEGDRVFALSMTNPFSFALSLPPPKGVPLWWDDGFSFSASVHPDAEELFRDSDLVMAPKFGSGDDGCCKATVLVMRKMYGEYLATHFTLADESLHWQLFARRR